MRKADPLMAGARLTAITSTDAISTLRRWCNRLLLGCALTLIGVGLYQGVTALAAKQVKTLTVRGDVRHIDTEVIQARLTPRITDGFMACEMNWSPCLGFIRSIRDGDGPQRLRWCWSSRGH